MPYNSAVSTNDANVSEIAEFRVPQTIQQQFLLSKMANLVTPAFYVRHVTYPGATYQSFIGKQLPTKLQFTFGQTDFRNASLSHRLAAWARYPRLNVTCNIPEIQTATRDQPYNKQLYRLVIKRVHIVNNRRVKTVFAVNQRGLFRVSTSVLCD